MIVRSRFAGNVAVRSVEFGQQPLVSRGLLSAAGVSVTNDQALGLSAVGSAFRLVAGVIACLPINVWEGRKASKRLLENHPLQPVLDQPDLSRDYFQWLYDVAASLEACENALLWKVKDAGRVVELVPLDMDYVSISVEDGRKVFSIRERGRIGRYTSSEILHVRGHVVKPGDPVGVSRLTLHRDPLGAMVARERFEGKYFANNTQIGLAVEFPQGVTAEQAESWKDSLVADHAGADRAFRPLVVGGGAQVKSFPISLSDAQWVDAEKLNVEEVGRIMDVASSLLNLQVINAEVLAADTQRFLNFQLTPRLRRIESALSHDPDLFGGQAAYPLFEIDDLMFANAMTRAQVHHWQIQNGTLLVDEARAELGRGPLPDGLGLIPQVTPVGGAPNPGQPAADQPEE